MHVFSDSFFSNVLEKKKKKKKKRRYRCICESSCLFILSNIILINKNKRFFNDFFRQAREYIADKTSVDSDGSLDLHIGTVSQSPTGGYENEGFQPSAAVSLVRMV